MKIMRTFPCISGYRLLTLVVHVYLVHVESKIKYGGEGGFPCLINQ